MSDCVPDDEDFSQQPALDVVAGRAVNRGEPDDDLA